MSLVLQMDQHLNHQHHGPSGGGIGMSSSADMLSDMPLGGNGAKKRNDRRMGNGPNGGSNGGGS